MKIENTPRSTVYDTPKLFDIRLKRQSLLHSGHPSAFIRVKKRAVVRFCRNNIKATYSKVKQKLQLNYNLRTIGRIVRKQGIKM